MDEAELNKKFNKYITKVKKLESVSDEDKLYLYSQYKQALFGDNNSDKPSLFDRVSMAKWKAWNGVKGQTKEESINKYIRKVKDLYGKEPKDSAGAQAHHVEPPLKGTQGMG